ncbi:MAG: Exodeoxyribonuclease 7 small subunit [Lentisphaerae bacterium ADurb.BinA184]|nr:MAG: Exodeoxyribonuclease 7 small subunit [Lentisphaerae bacterium ADurb.BinA184]
MPAKNAGPGLDEKLSFEKALEELEKIVAEMESGDLPLDKTMARFERGMKLAKFCSAKLGETERRIEILMRDAKGEPEWKQVTADDDGDGDGGAVAGDEAPPEAEA